MMLQVMLNTAESNGKKGKKSRKDNDSGSSSSSSSGSRGGLTRNLKAVRQRDKWVHKRPRKVVRKYSKHCRKILSVEAYEPWRLHQVNCKIDWGRIKNSPRIHYFISKALELLLKDDLDNDSWEDAAAYMPGGDPLEKTEFAGDESEVAIIAARGDAKSKLRKNRAQADKKDEKHDD
jgi:hypothetical protein